MMDTIVGIDLGTTNSEIAIYQDGRPLVLADERGQVVLPSVVGLSETGELLVGDEARNQFMLYPERTVRSIKRRMGTEARVRLGERDYAPQEISAMILSRLKAMAQLRLGGPVRRAVITVPAYFSDAQRQATREAGEIAGLEVMRIINEPTAAALVYEAAQHQGKRILVYDLGGGTFDVSVVRIEGGVVEVISSHGNNQLGGDDFDEKIVAHVLEHLKLKHGVSVSDQPQAMARILRSAETAKKHLSDHPFARIEEEYLAVKDGRPVNLSLELSRDEYEQMIMPFIEETLGAIHVALGSAGLTSSQVDEILLVGGATRTPLIRRRLIEAFGRTPRGEVDPDLILLAKSSGGGWYRHKPDKGGLACSRAWCACEPGAKAAEVHGRCREHVLQVRFGEPDITGTAQVHGPHTQRQRAFDAGTAAIFGGKRLSGLARPGRFQRFMLLASPWGQQATGGASAVRLQRTGFAVCC